MILKEYQEKAIKDLIKDSEGLLRHRGKKLVFKAPTGSGKTIMAAEFLKQFILKKFSKEQYSFIWIAPRQLHLQSKEKLESYYEESQALRCSLFEDLDGKRIGDNEILFFNWESINRREGINLYIRENEQEFYLSKVLDNTRDNGSRIILIIDESHFSTDTENANKLKDMFDPELTIEVSATPVFINADETVSVAIEDVIDEGMIKESVILNENFRNVIHEGRIESDLSNDSDELVIEEAFKKRNEIIAAFKEENANVNPLIIIQLPPRIRQSDEDLKQKIIKLLDDKYKLTTANGKLGIYLAEQHENIDEIAKNDNETEVLLFKQGIALGWDCPRAQILVLFREWHDTTFSIQTVGRIMRMPEPEKGHYDNEILNQAYVYTNLSNIFLEGDAAKGYISIYTSRRKKEYEMMKLISHYSLRQREKTRLSPLFIKLFLSIADKGKLKDKLNLKLKELKYEIISDWSAENIDLGGANIFTDRGTVDYRMSEEEIQKYFDHFIIKHLSPFYPEDRSVGRVKDAIYRFFDNKLEMQYDYKQDEIIKIVLHDQNIQKFIDVIDEAKKQYLEEVTRREKEIIFKEWEVPESIRYNENYTSENFSKSIMQPFFNKGNWGTERKFIEYLESNSDKIEWWFKNGDSGAVYFSVPYEYGGERSLFYVDFIIQFKDGGIGLFDTKTGITLRDAKAKGDGLQKYIKEQNKKGKKLIGGLVTNTDQRNQTERWVYFDGKAEDLSDRDWSKWKNMDL
ncbi:MAG: DEAD/DEAH box helicase family protein [bacterium]|nr:DEAD/DEAH box helicase family protein [bacterium]